MKTKLITTAAVIVLLVVNPIFPVLADVTPSTGECSSSDPTVCPSPSPSPSPSPTSSSPPSSTPSSSYPNWFSSLGSVILGIITNPLGAVNAFINVIIDAVASVWPSTPPSLKIAALIDSVAATMPGVGRGIIREFFVTISSFFALAVVIKIYKLLPFKAS